MPTISFFFGITIRMFYASIRRRISTPIISDIGR
jgi:hypothetical protein